MNFKYFLPTARLLTITSVALCLAAQLQNIGCASQKTIQKETLLSEPVAKDLTNWISKGNDSPAPTSNLVSGLQSFWNLDYPNAFPAFLKVLKTPSERIFHPLAANEIAIILKTNPYRYDEAFHQFLQEVNWNSVDPLARVRLLSAAQLLARREHSVSKNPTPFLDSNYGIPVNWDVSPLYSNNIVADFKNVFPPEKAPLPPTLLSPHDAENSPRNQEDVAQRYQTIYPSTGSGKESGIYYFESFIDVKDLHGKNEPVDFYLYVTVANNMRLSIDAKTIFDIEPNYRLPQNYLAEIRLTPGLHRLLIKQGGNNSSTLRVTPRFIPVKGNPIKELQEGIIRSYSNCFGEKPSSNDPWCTHPKETFSPDDVTILVKGKPISNWIHYGITLKDLLASDRSSSTKQNNSIDKNDTANKAIINALSDADLFILLENASLTQDDPLFQYAWKAFSKRHPNFPPSLLTYYNYVGTLPYYPPEYSKGKASEALQQALKEDPDSPRLLFSLYLDQRGKTVDRDETSLKKLITLLEKHPNKDVISSLYEELGNYYNDQNWNEEAERAFKKAIQLSPNNCGAAKQLQEIYYQRNFIVSPEKIIPHSERCPQLEENYFNKLNNEKSSAYRLKEAEIDLAQHPFSLLRLKNYATQLQKSGQLARAYQLVKDALVRQPKLGGLYELKAQLELAGAAFAPSTSEATEKEGKFSYNQSDATNQAIQTYQDAIAKLGDSSSIRAKIANLQGSLLLRDFIPDGIRIAAEEVKRAPLGEKPRENANSSDSNNMKEDAYYVYDYSVEKIFPDNSRVSLTYALIRVMSKGAIDQYAEQSIPDGAEPLIIRTIKQDGTTQTPDENLNKSTYSMTGLAEGDFIETAWLSFRDPTIEPTSFNTSPFFFKMPSIGTRHSEYVFLGLDNLKKADGSKGYKILSMNGAPQPVEKTMHGEKALTFLATNNPSPRPEPATDDHLTFLPWVQIYNDKGFKREVSDKIKFFQDTVKESSQFTPDLIRLFDKWSKKIASQTKAPFDSAEWLEALYLLVTAHSTDTSDRQSAGQMVYSRRGQPSVLFIAALKYFGIPFEIYATRSSRVAPIDFGPLEPETYSNILLKIKTSSGKDIWTTVGDRLSSFNTAPDELFHQKAICVTCQEPPTPENIKEIMTPGKESFRSNQSDFRLNATLDKEGTLTGVVEIINNGVSAQAFRKITSMVSNAQLRERLADNVLNQLISGSIIRDSSFLNTLDRRKPLIFRIAFTTPNFAKQTKSGGLLIDQSFLPSDATGYVRLPNRTTPMLLPPISNGDASIKITLPPNMNATLESAPHTKLSFEEDLFERSTSIKNNVLEINAATHTRLHHVQPSQYSELRNYLMQIKNAGQLRVSMNPK